MEGMDNEVDARIKDVMEDICNLRNINETDTELIDEIKNVVEMWMR